MAHARIHRRLRSKAILVAAILVAAALRLPSLGLRPMHADESIHADKLGTLLEGGGYAYDPADYHGPTLYYLTLPAAWVRGETRYVELDEVTLRVVPAVLGVALVACHVWAAASLGAPAAAFAALLTAVSPAMVFYSRDYIHETPLVLFSFGALLAAGWYRRRPGVRPALVAGLCAGLMLATKETALLALGSMFLAVALTWRLGNGSVFGGGRGRDLVLALTTAALVAALLFSSFLGHPPGVVDALRTWSLYVDRAHTASVHFHPWDYYLRLLLHFPAEGTPFWTEGAILLLAAVGWGAGWTRRGLPGVDAKALHFLGFYSLAMIAAYAAIPYKTPWCLLGFLHGCILLAGAGAAFLLRVPSSRSVRGLLAIALLGAVAHLGWQSFAGSFRFASDPRNPYVYAQTGVDVNRVAGRVRELTRAHPEGSGMPIQVFSRENLWPLPWYLRGLSGVEWWTGVSDDAPIAPVILLTPEMESALVRRLYDLPPPGERELYMRIFEDPVWLRPGVELRGYAAKSLWDDFRRLEAEPAGEP
jgi:uncharacterized protein (TIGR03663 family)